MSCMLKLLGSVVLCFATLSSFVAAEERKSAPLIAGSFHHTADHPALRRGVSQERINRHGHLQSWEESGRLFVAFPLERAKRSRHAKASSTLLRLVTVADSRSYSMQKIVDSTSFGWLVVYADCGNIDNAAVCAGNMSPCESARSFYNIGRAGLYMLKDQSASMCSAFSGVPVSAIPSDLEASCRVFWGGENNILPLPGGENALEQALDAAKQVENSLCEKL